MRVVHCAELSLTLSDFCMDNAYPGVSAVRDCGYLSGEGSWGSPLAVEAEMRLLEIAMSSRPPQVLMSFVSN